MGEDRVNGLTYLSEVILNFTGLIKSDFCRWEGVRMKVIKSSRECQYLSYVAVKRTWYSAY